MVSEALGSQAYLLAWRIRINSRLSPSRAECRIACGNQNRSYLVKRHMGHARADRSADQSLPLILWISRTASLRERERLAATTERPLQGTTSENLNLHGPRMVRMSM